MTIKLLIRETSLKSNSKLKLIKALGKWETLFERVSYAPYFRHCPIK